MNMILHGIEEPVLKDVDALSEANSGFDNVVTLAMANPPFKGSLDNDAVDTGVLRMVDSKKTELLFLALILKGLKKGGRAAVIIPDGVLFGNSKAHKQIRKLLVDNHRLQAVISMPSGVFKPYAGVSTGILIFTKTGSGGTDKVWFYDMHGDGLTLDDKRQPDEKNNDIPDILRRWQQLDKETNNARTDKSFFVPVDEIRANGYDLSINRYKEVVHEEKTYATPKELIADIRKLDNERAEALKKLEASLARKTKVKEEQEV
jgi:type I restriction enzyme M protein